jgi:hypothetical protein
MKGFWYEEQLYIRCIPAKSLFKSTLVHEVINRGDIFGIRVSDSALTIISGNSLVEHVDIQTMVMGSSKDPKDFKGEV